jgi:hypothetical protein
MSSPSKPWDESVGKKYRDSLTKIHEVKEWRAREATAGRPSSFEDYCLAHGLCAACRTVGLTWNAETQGFRVVGMEGDAELFEVCPICGGTGTLDACL